MVKESLRQRLVSCDIRLRGLGAYTCSKQPSIQYLIYRVSGLFWGLSVDSFPEVDHSVSVVKASSRAVALSVTCRGLELGQEGRLCFRSGVGAIKIAIACM